MESRPSDFMSTTTANDDAKCETAPKGESSSLVHSQYQLLPSYERITNENAENRNNNEDWWRPRWLEIPFETRVEGEDNNQEVTAWAMDAAASGVSHDSAAFLGPALIYLATQVQGDGTEGEGGLWWLMDGKIRPSSLLTLSSSISTIMAAILLPITGIMIDYTSHRKTLGAMTAAILVITNFIPIFLGRHTLFLSCCSQILLDLSFLIHIMILLAYLQNLTTKVDVLAIYSAKFTRMQLGFGAGYMLLVLLWIHLAQNVDLVTTARVSHVISAVVGFFLMGYAWTWLFQSRPPLQQLSINDTDGEASPRWKHIFRASFKRLKSTLQEIWFHYPALKWFLITLLFSPDIGNGAYRAIFSTLMTSLCKMNSGQITIAYILALLSTLPGSWLSQFICTKLEHGNALGSFQMCLISTFLVVVFTYTFVRGPEDAYPWVYLSISGLGLCLGWMVTSQRVLFCTLIPRGRDTEFMGIILCIHQLLGWFTPFIFGLLNQSGVAIPMSMLVSMNIGLFLALIFSCQIGRYEEAMRQVGRTL